MSRPPIVLDCDPGIDDAFAVFCAVRFTDLVAVTTVSGNVGIDDTTRNARYLVELAGAPSVPVHRGAAAPLEVAFESAARIHGPHGLGPIHVPDPAVPEAPTDAAAALIELAGAGPLTIVATGPLTNVATAVRLEPRIADSIVDLYWMGGSTERGNVRPGAEFNCWADPHAVDECLAAGLPLTMFGLNLTRQVRMGEPHRRRLAAVDAASARTAARLLEYYESHGVQDGLGQPMHDPCAVLGLTHPRLFTLEPAHMVVTTSGEHRGRTRVTSTADPLSTPITLAVSADADAVIELIMAAAEQPLESS